MFILFQEMFYGFGFSCFIPDSPNYLFIYLFMYAFIYFFTLKQKQINWSNQLNITRIWK